MLEKSLGNIDWEKDATQIELLVRGLNPWPSAYTYLGSKILKKIWSATVIEEKKLVGAPGEIVKITKEGFIIKCGQKSLLLNEIQLQGKKRMAAGAFLRGYDLEVGEMLGRRC